MKLSNEVRFTILLIAVLLAGCSGNSIKPEADQLSQGAMRTETSMHLLTELAFDASIERWRYEHAKHIVQGSSTLAWENPKCSSRKFVEREDCGLLAKYTRTIGDETKTVKAAEFTVYTKVPLEAHYALSSALTDIAAIAGASSVSRANASLQGSTFAVKTFLEGGAREAEEVAEQAQEDLEVLKNSESPPAQAEIDAATQVAQKAAEDASEKREQVARAQTGVDLAGSVLSDVFEWCLAELRLDYTQQAIDGVRQAELPCEHNSEKVCEVNVLKALSGELAAAADDILEKLILRWKRTQLADLAILANISRRSLATKDSFPHWSEITEDTSNRDFLKAITELTDTEKSMEFKVWETAYVRFSLARDILVTLKRIRYMPGSVEFDEEGAAKRIKPEKRLEAHIRNYDAALAALGKVAEKPKENRKTSSHEIYSFNQNAFFLMESLMKVKNLIIEHDTLKES